MSENGVEPRQPQARPSKSGARLTISLLFAAAFALAAPPAFAHCDGLDGPVVGAARQALATGDVNPVLIWVQPKDADEVTHAFKETLAVRRLNSQARDLADRHFFETLVRLHRAGENAPYTGLKPAGRDLGPAIPAADKALETGSDDTLAQLLTGQVRAELHRHFQDVMAKRTFRQDDVNAGREYVEAYVAYVHVAERLYEAANQPSTGHYEEGR
jgi:hypothetical protein